MWGGGGRQRGSRYRCVWGGVNGAAGIGVCVWGGSKGQQV